MNLMRRPLIIIAALALIAAFTLPASARSIRVGMLDADLKNLPWGKNAKSTLKWVSWKLDVEYGPRLKRAVDKADRARLKEQKRNALKAVSKSLVHFKGKKTGLEIGLVGSEFVHGAGESVLTFKQGSRVHYFFFSKGKLWKYARALKSKGTFAQRVKALGKDFGLPSRTKMAGGQVEEATWVGDKVEMTIRNARKIYGSDLLIVSHRKLAAKAIKQRKGKKPATKPAIDPEIGDIVDK